MTRMAQKPDPIDGLLWATYALSNVMAALHLPTVLRGLRLQAPEGLAVESWSRLGSFVVFIAAGDLLWLAICGSPWWVDIVQLWSLGKYMDLSFFRVRILVVLKGHQNASPHFGGSLKTDTHIISASLCSFLFCCCFSM